MTDPERRRVDCVVVGGGPAGSATALALLRAGRSVALLERGHYEDPRIGETLPPESRRLLAELDVLPAFEEDGHLASPGIVSFWGSREPQANDFIFNPYGHGWHVARPRFDRMLAQIAEERGALVHLDAVVDASRARPGAPWEVLAHAGGRSRCYESDLVVDATGRSPLPFGPRSRKETFDRLVALVGFGSPARSEDRRTILEAAELGWWYCANLPGDRVVAAFTADPGSVGPDFARLWRDELRKTEVVAGYVRDIDSVAVSAVRCATYLRSPIVEDGWVAVGDAASTYDPLSSLGICKALETGIRAAKAAVAGRLDEYDAWVRSSFRSYLETRSAYYALERRWPDSPFWSARHARQSTAIVKPM